MLLLVEGKTVLRRLELDLGVRELGHRVGDVHVPLAVGEAAREDDVDLLKRAALRLDVEEGDEGEEAEVDDAEEEEGAEATPSGEHGRRPHHDGEVPGPVGHRGDGVGVGTDGVGRDLGGVEPGELEPSAEDEVSGE